MAYVAYSARIRLVSSYLRNGNGLPRTNFIGGKVQQSDDGWDSYRDRARAALDAIANTDPGRHMIDEINQSEHLVKVGSPMAERIDLDPGPQLHNGCVVTGDAQYYRAIDTADALSHVLAAAGLRIAGDVAAFQGSRRSTMKAFVESCCTRCVWRDAATPWNHGWEVVDVAVPATQHAVLKYAFERHLTPGAGSPAVVIWSPDSTSFETEMAGRAVVTSPDGTGGAFVVGPASIGLAHELIHAWRGVTGRGIFPPGDIRDEHMTVGLLPWWTADTMNQGAGNFLNFLSWLRDGLPSNAITENAVRNALGRALRPIY